MEKEKATKGDKVFVFRVILDLESPKMWMGEVNQEMRKSKKAPWREVAMLDKQTLYDFAEAINDAFGFMFDHCFGFYSNLGEREMYDSDEMYELFTDLEDVDSTPGAQGVEATAISQAFQEKGKEMLFYFDYGDGWRFRVCLKDIQRPKENRSYPVLLGGEEESPEQYPPWE